MPGTLQGPAFPGAGAVAAALFEQSRRLKMAGPVQERTSPVYARDASPAAVSAAFAEQARRCKVGLYGPINPPMIYVPMTPQARTVQRTPIVRARPSVPVIKPAPPKPDARLETMGRIRSSPYAIGGYAATFNVRSPNVGIVKPGAYAQSLREGGWFLLWNHRNAEDHGAPSLASMSSGTMHAEEDEHGLWIEAALPREQDSVRIIAAASGMSMGYVCRCAHPAASHDVIHTELAVWEVSVVTRPLRPARVGTWFKPNFEARQERSRLRAGGR